MMLNLKPFIWGRKVVLLVFISLVGCAGVNNLQNPAQLSSGTAFDDQATEVLLRRHIIKEGDKNPLRVKVIVFNRKVLLVGEAAHLATAEGLEVTAAQVKGVRRVFNRIKVANPIASYKGLEDIIIDARVHFMLASIKELNKVKIKRIVDRNSVYLMGLVTSEQADIATAALSKIKGVKQIITVFEYI